MPRTLLIVDDVRTNRLILKKILSDEYEVLECENGREAIELLSREHERISAVLLDLTMPVMGGFGVLSSMREKPALSRIPVIITTGELSSNAEAQALIMGANDYVTKPYNSTVIKRRIWNAINLRETTATIDELQRDRLTGLYNRETFFDMARAMLSGYEPGHFIMTCFNVDSFKVINDQYGVEKGDEVLKHIARCIDRWSGEHSGLCCRVMADSFAVLYPAEYSDSESIKANHLEAMTVKGIGRPVSIRIGRYTVRDLSLSPSAMYDRAALAEASVKGRYGEYIAEYDESMRDHLLREQQIVTEMGAALVNGEFEPWFQPQYNHSTGALIGAEALVRWRHPGKGLIPPDEFIPVFEQNGFVYELDKFVWEHCCVCLRRWLDEGRSPLALSVNISRYDVLKSDLIPVITGLTEKYRVPAELLRLEITESAFASSGERIINVVKQLRQLGFTVEIDDFGSGYSSLNTLKDVPADVLKLDMRFLENSENSQRGGNILESVVRMAKWLGMSVIAEGVETREQANYLKSIGCNYVQGYLYAKPMPLCEYEALAANSGKEEKLLALVTVENLDNNAFWDPKSMDTLIFNSYIGGACIFEYHKGNIELLRANDKYAQVIGSAGMTVDDALKLNWSEHLNDENRHAVMSALKHSIASGDEVTEEFVFLDLPGCPKETHLRSSMRVIASSDDRYLVYCTNENITAQREAEEKERRASEQVQAIMDDAGSGITAIALRDGTERIILANDKYYEIMGYTREQYDAEIKNVFDCVHPLDRANVEKEALGAGVGGKGVTIEYRAIRRSGECIWVRAVLSMTRFTGIADPVQLCVISDITSEKRAEQELHEQDDQLRFLNDTAHDLLAQTDSEKAIEEVLWKLMDYFAGNRVYIFEFDREHGVASNTYEVVAEGITSEKANLQSIPLEMCALWMDVFREKSFLTIPSVDDLGPGRVEKPLLLAQGISSLIAVPLKRDGQYIGLIGIDDPRQQLSRVERLLALGDYIAVMITRRDLTRKILSDSAALMTLMNDTPGGFCRMRLFADTRTASIIYANDGFCSLVAMTPAEVTEKYRLDAVDGIHPGDRELVRLAYESAAAGNGQFRVKCRLLRGFDGADFVHVLAMGRLLRGDAGEAFMNAYFSDITEEIRAEDQQKELLDNLPCGAALYAYNGKHLSAVHMNKRYMELVGRSAGELAMDEVTEAVHPDDKAIIIKEVAACIEQGRDASCDIRVLYGHDEYRPFHVTGRIIDRGDGTYAIYATYTPLTEGEMSVKDTLPFILSAIMGSTSELTFAKDREFRYLCSSNAFAMMAGLDNERDILGKTDYDLFDKELADRFRRDDEELIRTGRAFVDVVEPIPSDDGIPHYSRTSKYVLKDTLGNAIGLYGTGRDITKNREAYAQLKLLTDSIPGGLATYACTDRELRLTYFNDGFCALFGFSREEYSALSSADPLGRVFEEDMPELLKNLDALINDNASIECNYRVHVRGGGYRWIKHRSVATDRHNSTVIINAALFDITKEQEATDTLRRSEEEYRLAIEHSGNIICRFNVADRLVSFAPDVAAAHDIAETVADVPYGPVRLDEVATESREAYVAFYESIINGGKSGTATFLRKFGNDWLWLEAHFSTIFSSAGDPVTAVISFNDVTERREKEAIYKKWQQSLQEKTPETYTLFRYNLSKNSPLESVEGSLLDVVFDEGSSSFEKRTDEYVEQFVFDADRERYTSALAVDTLIANYYRGKRTASIEYREKRPDGDVRWLRLTIELVEYPDSTDIEIYLMYENIDDVKKAELLTIERAETDPLTGVLNRTTFALQADSLIRSCGAEANHALLMLDIDGFKLVNDVFGHAAGDQALIDMANSIRSVLRRDDLVGRLGGDEFVIFLSDVPNDAVVSSKAAQLCALLKRSFSMEVQVSVSVGIAVCPRDGGDFETLYKKVDDALYHVKGLGKDGFAFYHDDMADEHLKIEPESPADAPRTDKKRRMLIVDDNRIDYDLLSNMFKNDFIIEKAKDGSSALIRLRHYGSAISVVLLDLAMPGMDGFTVLDRMQASPEMQTVPVIVVSGDESRTTLLRAIKAGATDYVTKPVDGDLLRIRVTSAVSKAENERLRAQNSVLMIQNDEVTRYKTVLEHTGTAVVEYDWVKGVFTYDPSMSAYLAGIYDERKLWHILLSDMVGDAMTVRRLQSFMRELAEDRNRTDGRLTIRLKTPKRSTHFFRVALYKLVDEFGLAIKIIMTFNDMGADPASERI